MAVKQTIFKRLAEMGQLSLMMRLFLMMSKSLEDKGRNLVARILSLPFLSNNYFVLKTVALTQFSLS